MAEELDRALTVLAERGAPRGAAAVLDAAREETSSPSIRTGRQLRRGLVVAMGTAGAVLVVGAVLLFVGPLGGGETPPATVAPVVTRPPIPGGLSHPLNEVEALAFAPDGQLWAATGGGVVRWNLETGRPTVFGEADGIPSSAVIAVDIASDGTVWVAASDWIARYDGSWQVFSSLNAPELDSQIEAMAVDESGVVWLDVAGEAPLRFDGSWTQITSPPAGTWQDDSGTAVAADGTLWTTTAEGIVGTRGTEATTLVVPAELATRRQTAITLAPVANEEALLVSTSIGDLEFTTMQMPVGYSFFATAATPYGPVATEGFTSLRWSTDGVTWEGTIPALGPWRISTDGGDVIVQGDGYVRYSWDGTTWVEESSVEIPGGVADIAFGPRGTVALRGDSVFYSADRVTFVPADSGPDPEVLSTETRSCVMNGPSSSTSPPQHQIGPVLATDAGFVVVTPAHPDNWSRTPICEPLLWFSADGLGWDLVSSQSPFGERAIVHRIAERGGTFVAVGATPSATAEGAIWVSHDALTWQRAGVAMNAAVGVAGGDLGWMVTGHAVGSSSDLAGVDMWFSPDGVSWDGPYEGPAALGTVYFLPELAVGRDAVYGVGGTHDTYIIGRLQE
jgi:hypothetical protein